MANFQQSPALFPRGTLQAFNELFTPSSFKHVAFNYSEKEVGLRHPDGPVGLVLRDQGQADLYAGKSRVILGVDGIILNSCRWWATCAESIKLQASSISRLYIQGKTLNQQVFAGQTLAGLSVNLPENLGLITSDLLIDTRTGRLISGFVPFSQVFSPQRVFDPISVEDTPRKRQLDVWFRAIGVKK
jgi:hypothetical protein